jgi:hypothetical protein
MMRKLSSTAILGALRRKLFLPLLAIAAFSPIWLAAQTPPIPKHIVIVIEENRSFKQIEYFIKHHPDSYMARLKREGAYFTSFFARLHPSQPNYIELFSGDRYSVFNDDPNPKIHAPNLSSALIARGKRFTGYAEGLPSSSFDRKSSGSYVRKHCPWISFADIPEDSSQPFTKFPKDFASLPELSFVIPNQRHDMHGQPLQLALGYFLKLFKKDPLMKTGDVWLEQNLKAYVEWAKVNDSLLIVTWDEDDHGSRCSRGNKTQEHPCETEPSLNRIPTLFVGPMVKPGLVPTQYTHMDLLRTIEKMYDLPLLGKSKDAKVIDDVWQ